MRFLLSHFVMKIFDDNVGLLVKAALFVHYKTGADSLAFNYEIVHLLLTSFGFLLSIESQESVLSRLLRDLVNVD